MAIEVPAGQKVTVKVPASSANLGPGFDTLGLALGLYDTVDVEVIPQGLEVEIFGEGEDDLPRDGSHLVVKAIRAGLKAADVDVPLPLPLLLVLLRRMGLRVFLLTTPRWSSCPLPLRGILTTLLPLCSATRW